MLKLKRILASVLVVMLAFTTFVGCGADTTTTDDAAGSTATEDSATAEDTGDDSEKSVVKIALTSWTTSYMLPLIEEFEASQDMYTVETIEVASGSDMYSKMTMMISAPETSPDVMLEDGFMINADAAAGRLMPLDDVLADWPDLEQYYPAVLDGARGVDGVLYGIPKSTDTQGIYYDMNLFASAGIEVPWQPTTWQDVIDAALALKAANADVEDFTPLFMFATKTYTEETSMRTFQLLLSGTDDGFPQQLYNTETEKWVVDTENVMKVFNFINDVYNVNEVGPAPSLAATANVDDILLEDLMQNGKVGMYATGSWTMGSWGAEGKFPWAEAESTWGYANWPTVDGSGAGFTTISGGWTWAIPENANNKDGGLELLKFINSYDGVMDHLNATGNVTPRMDAAEDPAYLEQDPSVVIEATAQLDFTHFRPSVDGYSSLSTMFATVVESIAIGTATPEEAMATYESEMKRIVGEENVEVK